MEEGANQDSGDGSLQEPPVPARSNMGREGFSTTRWTMIVAAGRPSDRQGQVAMEELCRTYWYPLYAHVRRRGYSREDAEDLTQSFFARFLEKNY